jgi:hypothetical protein
LRPEDDAGMRYALVFSARDFRVWFVTTLEFLENGNDYIVNVVDFGRLEKITTAHMTFDRTAVEKIKTLLEAYFLGPNSRFMRLFECVSGPKPTCKGVHFKEGWIRVGKTSRWLDFRFTWKR